MAIKMDVSSLCRRDQCLFFCMLSFLFVCVFFFIINNILMENIFLIAIKLQEEVLRLHGAATFLCWEHYGIIMRWWSLAYESFCKRKKTTTHQWFQHRFAQERMRSVFHVSHVCLAFFFFFSWMLITWTAAIITSSEPAPHPPPSYPPPSFPAVRRPSSVSSFFSQRENTSLKCEPVAPPETTGLSLSLSF